MTELKGFDEDEEDEEDDGATYRLDVLRRESMVWPRDRGGRTGVLEDEPASLRFSISSEHAAR